MNTLERGLISSTRHIKSVFSSHLPSAERSLVSDRIQSLIDYTVGDGKNKRAQLVISSFEAVGGRNENRETALRCAVAIELLQSFLLVADDVMDSSITRRGKPCWYRKETIGLSAINDAFLLQSAAESELREAFKGHSNENIALSAFRSTVRRTIVGQMLDTATAANIEQFNWERYAQLVEHKTSHYTFLLPLTLGMLAGGAKTPVESVRQAAFRIGYLFQSQDDWLDVYGETALTGKLGSDIKDKKCTWLSCKALEIMRKSKDGRMDRFKSAFTTGDEQQVTDIYQQLQLSRRFKEFEDELSGTLINEIESIPQKGLIPLFKGLVKDARNRQK